MSGSKILQPNPDAYPNPDCPKCHGEGVPQSYLHLILADDQSKMACPECHESDVHQKARDFMDRRPDLEPGSLDEWLVAHHGSLSEAERRVGNEILNQFYEEED